MPFIILDLIEKEETLTIYQIFNAEVCFGQTWSTTQAYLLGYRETSGNIWLADYGLRPLGARTRQTPADPIWMFFCHENGARRKAETFASNRFDSRGP